MLSSVACPALQYFPHYLINGTILEKKVTEHKMCLLIFSSSFVWNVSHSKKTWARYDKKSKLGLHVKCPLLLSDFNETRIFSTDFPKNSTNIKFHENPSSGSQVVPCGRTDMTKPVVGCRKFCERAKNSLSGISPLLHQGTYSFIFEFHQYQNVPYIQDGSNMTGTDLCVNKPHQSRSYLNHLVYIC